DGDGNYVFQSVPVGRYTLKVASSQGFKAFEERDILLHVNDSLEVDAKMTIGASSETVEVVATPNHVELNTAELSGTIEGAQITQLPLNCRIFAHFLTQVPGVETDHK